MSNAYAGTPALEQKHISPDACQLTEALPPSDFSKSNELMQHDAGNVLRKDARLQRPDSATLRLLDERLEEPLTYASTPCSGRYVNGNLGNTGIDAATGDGAERRPTENPFCVSRNKPAAL
jgi:hypothetical protein